MAKNNHAQTGEMIVRDMSKRNPALFKEANRVAAAVARQLNLATEKFSEAGRIGGTVNAVAPGLLKNPGAVLPQITTLNAADTAVSRMMILNTLLSPEFDGVLEDFQFRLANASAQQQVDLLRSFSAVDWAALSRPAFEKNAPALAKLQGFLHHHSQMRGVEHAGLQDLLVLTRIPQFTQMLVLASGYGEIMLMAWEIFQQNRASLLKDNEENKTLVSRLDGILSEFTEAEMRRLQSAVNVVDLTEQLDHALQVAEMLAGMENRTADMLSRIDIDKMLVKEMDTHTEASVASQLKLLEEFVTSMHLLTKNKTRLAKINKAIGSLDLYIKCYIVFELNLAMLQVYIISGSAAIQTVLGNQLRLVGERTAMTFFEEQIAPFQKLTGNFENNFLLPQLIDDDGDISLVQK